MTSITYTVGDATAPPLLPAVVAHVVNDVGAFGAGFAAALASRWPGARADYLRWYRDGLQLGDVRFWSTGEGVTVAHLCAQHGLGRRNHPLRYDALAQCLTMLGVAARMHQVAVVMPRIGTGLAGGDWGRIEPLIAKACAGVDVTVFDLPGARS
jgi:O-acetyl-ADP-ribose deacetylase (regulator of RNase III)